MYLVTVYRDENIGLTLINYTSAEEIYRPLALSSLLLYLRLCSSCRLLFLYLLHRQVKHPLTQLVKPFRCGVGNLDIKVEYERTMNSIPVYCISFHAGADQKPD